MIPVLQIEKDGRRSVFSAGLHHIHLRATWNWDYKWVKMPLRDLCCPRKVLFTLADKEPGESERLKVLLTNGNLAGSFTNEQGETFRFDTELQVVKNQWHRVVVSYDLESMRFQLDGREGAQFNCRGPGLYDVPSVFGGMGGSAEMERPATGNPGWFEGYLRALTVSHRPLQN